MAKNTHLEHLEDDILNHGSSGGKNAISFLRELGQMLSEPRSSIRITTKWDGAPAVICGIEPLTGLFFVGTKSVFAKTNPKLMFTPADIDQNYSGQLASKLKACLEHLPKLGIKNVIQGDLLFTDDVSIKTIGGERVHSFQPNTIVYTVPVDSKLGSKISRAKVGIVFHTEYSGSSLDSMNASFGVDISSFQDTPDVYAATASFQDASGVANFSPAELTKYNSAVNMAEGSLKQASAFLDILGETGDGKFLLSTLFKQYFNTYIRSGREIANVKAVSDGFTTYYASLLDKEMYSKKTPAARDKYLKIKTDGLSFLSKNGRSVYFTVASYMNLQKAKNLVIRKLENVRDFGTFLRTSDGYKVTAPEGFVAIKSGSALKLVDRLEFSRANFTADKNWSSD
jgi:hypothetical protein